MTNRQQALTYTVLTACAVAIVLLLAGGPSGPKLTTALVLGIAAGVGSYVWMERH